MQTSINTPLDLYTDGGVIGVNPSPIGGTWAWCLVDATGKRVCDYSGVITPEQAGLPSITNNLTELLAIVNGREALPYAWTGTIHSDSWVSLQRVFLAAKLKNVPPWLVDRLQKLQRDGWLSGCAWKLLDGHPTKAQLAAGVGKRGSMVSEHNVWCDQACTQAGRALVTR
jgi:ribonuclease HI